jgi:hypothetical protein
MHGGSVAWLAMRRLVLAMTLASSLAFAGAQGDPTDGFSVKLEAKTMHEECARLNAGEKRKYYWKADNAVDFNIHYHEGPEVFYPVKRDGMRGDGGEFSAKKAQDYCWMWTARDKAVKLEGRIDSK